MSGRSVVLAVLLGVSAPYVALPASGQAGDQAGEEQPSLPDDLAIPPAPALSPADEARTFRLPPGFRIELVAAEPLVHDPVAMAWDHRGRLWVCEMRGFMPDVDGRGETEPVGSIAVLTDTDRDGRMDERAVFLDGLVLPRALLPIDEGGDGSDGGGGLLYIAPPDLVFARDTDGDGAADDFEVVDTGLGGIASPEHAVNGLMLGLDNWIRCANHPLSYRRVDGVWERRRTAGGGQWGITKDDLGRVFYDTNPDPLRGDPYPSHYAVRNPNHGTAAGVNVRYAHDLRVWPVRMTPGVNRGYREGLLNERFELTQFTAACGPLIHRGDALPPAYRGDAFVCEPAGNLVKRFALSEKPDGSFDAKNAGAGPDFLASTDERFRPVNLYDGPDGALYVVDMYRGVIQHRIFVTSFLRAQIVARGLEEPIGLGRIWRVVHEDHAGARGPDLEQADWSQLVQCLSHPNGWWRDAAQRMIVAEGADSRAARELLQRAALYSESPLGRMHALWALEGIGRLDPGLLMGALHDDDPGVLLAAVQTSEPFLHVEPRLAERMLTLARAGDARVRRQVILSLGENPTAATDEALLALLDEGAADASERSWFLSGMHRRELVFLDRLVPERWADDAPGRSRFVQALARAVAREGKSDAIGALLGSVDRLWDHWSAAALVDGLLAARPKGPQGEPGFFLLAEKPSTFDALSLRAETGELAQALGCLAWPGRADVELPQVRPLEPDELALFERGRALYAETCEQCHLSSGTGEAGKAPPLRHSEWVLGSEERLIRVVRFGLVGPLVVDGRTWDMEMPAWSTSAEDLAALLTYVRREWGHGADPVAPATVEAVLRDVERVQPFTVEELE